MLEAKGTTSFTITFYFDQAAESNRKPEQSSMFYAKGALEFIIPYLIDCLMKQVRLHSTTPFCKN